jgi:ubiquinone/menaquinone biosynthesis C-methylase UbiE
MDCKGGHTSARNEMSGIIFRFRYWVAKVIYEIIFFILVRDGSWQEEVFASLAPKAGDRVLDIGLGSSSTAVSLALRYPEAAFVGVDPSSRAVEKARQTILRKNLRNISMVSMPLQGNLPFDASSFDKAVCMLGFHDRSPEEKLRVAKEITRVLRRGGTLHVADFDKPENRGEGGILEFARRISGSAAAEPHMNGTWTEYLTKSGLVGVRRQSSHSIGIGRIAVLKARKR